MTDDLVAHARGIIDATVYLTLGTADTDGRPWTTPVYFAPGGDREFYWLSSTDARHSAVPGGRAVRGQRGPDSPGRRHPNARSCFECAWR